MGVFFETCLRFSLLKFGKVMFSLYVENASPGVRNSTLCFRMLKMLQTYLPYSVIRSAFRKADFEPRSENILEMLVFSNVLVTSFGFI